MMILLLYNQNKKKLYKKSFMILKFIINDENDNIILNIQIYKKK